MDHCISDFLREAYIQLSFQESQDRFHIIKLLGIAFEPGQGIDTPMIVTEWMPNGDLASFVTKHNLTTHQRLNWAWQIADGMGYLENCGLVHRDLAARNCLLDSLCCVKIADFGMSRPCENAAYYSIETFQWLPWAWLAPEIYTTKKFDFKTDVWAYGVTVWEMFSPGQLPYSHYGTLERGIRAILESKLLSRPKSCPKDVYEEVMLKCWNKNPKSRPCFEDLKSICSGFLRKSRTERVGQDSEERLLLATFMDKKNQYAGNSQ